MSKPFRKPKAGHQKPKRRKPRGQGSGGVGASRGMMTGIRTAFRSTVHGKGKDAGGRPSQLSRVIDIALWVAVAGAVIYFVSNARCTQ